MTDLPTGWPLAPAFGCQLDEDHPEQRLGQEFASFVETDALPVSTLRYLHRPSKLRSIWTRILALLREPAELGLQPVNRLPGLMAMVILLLPVWVQLLLPGRCKRQGLKPGIT